MEEKGRVYYSLAVEEKERDYSLAVEEKGRVYYSLAVEEKGRSIIV